MASAASVAPSSSWISTRQAAEALGVTERTIRRMCEERKIGSRVQRVKGRKPFRVVNAVDLERLAAEQSRPALISEVPAQRPPAMVKEREAAPVTYIVRPWLTLDEAAEFSGLPKSWLLLQARGGIGREPFVHAINVGTERRASWRFSRAALSR